MGVKKFHQNYQLDDKLLEISADFDGSCFHKVQVIFGGEKFTELFRQLEGKAIDELSPAKICQQIPNLDALEMALVFSALENWLNSIRGPHFPVSIPLESAELCACHSIGEKELDVAFVDTETGSIEEVFSSIFPLGECGACTKIMTHKINDRIQEELKLYPSVSKVELKRIEKLWEDFLVEHYADYSGSYDLVPIFMRKGKILAQWKGDKNFQDFLKGRLEQRLGFSIVFLPDDWESNFGAISGPSTAF